MTNEPLRILFAGTPDFSASHLSALIDSKHQLTAVLTQPDRPAGRGKKLQASPVKALAIEAGIPVYQPTTLRDSETQLELLELSADVMIVVAYGLILPQPVLDATRLGCLNVHASLLPRWRGAAPIQRAIEAGDMQTGITIMQMDAGLDTGPMLATTTCPISATTTGGSLHDALAEMGPPALLNVLEQLEAHQANQTVQSDSGATYAHKISKAEAQLDWQLDADALGRQVRAFNPFPVSFSILETERVRVWEAKPNSLNANEPPGTILSADERGICIACGTGQLEIQTLQLPGGKALTAQQVLAARQAQFAPGKQFDLPTTVPNT